VRENSGKIDPHRRRDERHAKRTCGLVIGIQRGPENRNSDGEDKQDRGRKSPHKTLIPAQVL